ncbi:MAG TPA: DUF2062 domain-containing protein [Burkholderiaceae bacterium]|nr:DUF2062 domain-containing protein [Burkholderiaceae bacterium]
MKLGRWRRLPDREQVLDNRLLRPFRHWLQHASLWATDRDSVARGVAIGFFFGILTPVAQIFFSAIAAVFLRGNLAVAAVSTLITNPFTFPIVYYIAFLLGSFITGDRAGEKDLELSEEAYAQALEVTGVIPTLLQWVTSIGAPLAIGVVSLAIIASVSGYLMVQTAWRLRDAYHRRRR